MNHNLLKEDAKPNTRTEPLTNELNAEAAEADQGGTHVEFSGRRATFTSDAEASAIHTPSTNLAAKYRYDLYGAAAKHDRNGPAGPFEKAVGFSEQQHSNEK